MSGAAIERREILLRLGAFATLPAMVSRALSARPGNTDDRFGLRGERTADPSGDPQKGAAAARRPRVICFTKPLQSLDYEELAKTVKRLGFDGVEFPVRPKGHVEPEAAADELPKAKAAFDAAGVGFDLATCAFVRPDDKHCESTLRTLKKLGVERYRMGYYRYRRGQPILAQLASFAPQLRDLAALNAEIGIQGIYQNHSGRQYCGAAIWDLWRILEDVPKERVAVAFDLAHATIEGGKSWRNEVELMRPRFGALYAKDYVWREGKVAWVPFGRGWTHKRFYREVAGSDFAGPISVHVEYLHGAKLVERIAALGRDREELAKLLAKPLRAKRKGASGKSKRDSRDARLPLQREHERR